ncbi:MAG: AAA family ATPase [Bdellovibrionota bacterium]
MYNLHEIPRGAFDLAQTEAMKRRNGELHALHLLHGFINHPKSYSHSALKEYRGQVETELKKLPTMGKALTLDQMRPGPSLSEWLTYANSEVIQSGREAIEERDLLKQLPKIFPQLKIDYNKFREEAQAEEEAPPTFLINLQEMASKGKLDPVIGRDKEIRMVMEILGRRGKNNPVLVGAAGVGKTAIVEGLALAIYRDNVPDVLKGKEVFTLDLGALMAGTKFRGEFEERMQAMLKFIKQKSGQAILFIDEIHQLVGAGRTDGAMDAANLLKPALARGELHCIGATTEDEYQKYILGDTALARRFRSVPIKEPSVEDAIGILMGVKDKFEGHHGIKISDEAIVHAVTLSVQYITDKYLPDKAIDLIDEACSSLKIAAEAMPAHLVDLESEIRSKMILSKVDPESGREIEKEAEKLKIKFEAEKKRWAAEVLSVKKVSELQNQLDRLKFDFEQAERQGNFEEASKIKYGMIPEIQKQMASFTNDWVLRKKDIAQVIAKQTGIPLEKILKSEQDRILELEGHLKKRVLGQDEAIHEVAGALMASHAGLTDETRPLGSFLLLGPSGVGKTETAKSVAQFLFNDEKKMIRIDLSEYSEKHSVAKLIGAPAGYVGYEEGGILTEAVRRNNYAVILFDEMEKAHEDFADILLQILDDGRLTDNRGRTINFKNTIIFITSNTKDYRHQFKPEVLGRLDAILHYNALTGDIHKELVNKQVERLNERLSSKKLVVELDERLIRELMERGFDATYGARPLQATFQKLVTRPLSVMLLSGNLPEGKIRASFDGQSATFTALNT